MFPISFSLTKFSQQQNTATWFSMAFQAGAINASGFLACHRFVTQTMGFARYFGAELSPREWLRLSLLAARTFKRRPSSTGVSNARAS